MPRVGSSKMYTSQLAHEPLGEDHLLLVSAGEVAHGLVERRGLDSEAADHLADQLADVPPADDPRARVQVEDRERRVVEDGEPEDQALLLALLGDQGDPVPHGVPGAADTDFASLDEDPPGLLPSVAVDELHDLRAAGADKARETRGSRPRCRVKETSLQTPWRVRPSTRSTSSRGRGAGLQVLLGELPADHVADDVVHGEGRQRRGDDPLARPAAP